VASQVGAMVSVNAFADRPAQAMADGEVLRTGRRAFKWLDAPHVPHGWDNGFMMELSTRTMFSGDLFTQGGSGAIKVQASGVGDTRSDNPRGARLGGATPEDWCQRPEQRTPAVKRYQVSSA
jgi:hypothetical protein